MSALNSHGITIRSASGYGSGRKQHRIDDAEDGGVGAKTERQRQNGERGEAGPPRKRSKCVLEGSARR